MNVWLELIKYYDLHEIVNSGLHLFIVRTHQSKMWVRSFLLYGKNLRIFILKILGENLAHSFEGHYMHIRILK